MPDAAETGSVVLCLVTEFSTWARLVMRFPPGLWISNIRTDLGLKEGRGWREYCEKY